MRLVPPWLLLTAVTAVTSPAKAQVTGAPSRFIEADRVTTHVVTLGLERRRSGEPVLVLMSGADSGLETWGDWLVSVSEIAPLVAYDRPGIGKSEYDGRPLTLSR